MGGRAVGEGDWGGRIVEMEDGGTRATEQTLPLMYHNRCTADKSTAYYRKMEKKA